MIDDGGDKAAAGWQPGDVGRHELRVNLALDTALEQGHPGFG